jgi:hypothetical protein
LFVITGSRKKKGLTDPVDFIPFPNQSLRSKVTPAPKAIIPPIQREPIPEKVEPKVVMVPTGQLNTPNVSIKKILEKKEEEKNDNELIRLNLPSETFTIDQVNMHWRKYAFEMKEKGLETFYNAMIKKDVIIKEETNFVMEVDNQIQIDYISPYLPEINAYFRKELKNYSIQITLSLNQNPNQEVKFLSGKDKFAALARKYPNLHTLKNTFNLDIEY